MSLIHDIAELMLQEGVIKGQAAREQIAEQEEMRQAKHRVLKNTLKGIALGLITYYTGGVGTGPAAAAMFGNRKNDILGGGRPSQIPQSPGRVPAGLGYSTFAGPMTRDDWHVPTWDEEGIG